LQGDVWYGRYRESVIGSDGKEYRIRGSTLLGHKKDLTKRLAERRLEVILAPINSLSYRPGRIATVEEFAERWKVEVLSQRKDSTIAAAHSHLRNQILPHLGKMRLNELNAENQQMFVTRLTGTISRKMLLNVLGTLSSMLKTARSWGYTCEGLKFGDLVLPEKDVTKEAAHFEPCTAAKIINMAEGQFRVMFATAAMTGVRPGELLALQSRDFDFERNLLTIRRRAWRRKIATPKTKPSQAVLPIPDALAQMVREHIKTLKSEWLFVTKRGNLFHSDKVVKLRLWPILDKLGIPRCGLHAFRHTHSTMLLDIANPKQHQEQMRHADPRVTIGVYSHVNAEARRGVVEKLASILDLNGPKFESIGQVIQ